MLGDRTAGANHQSDPGSAELISSEVSDPDPCDERAFSALYQMWHRQVHRWIAALGGPGIDADDLTQEVFIVVHRQLGRFDGVNLAGWLYRIAQLTVRDHRQRAWFRKIFLRPRDTGVDEVVSHAATQDEQLDGKKRKKHFYRLVTQLNPRWRNSFLMFEVAGLSGEEIATLRGLPPATVRTHLSRARKELADLAARHRDEHAEPHAARSLTEMTPALKLA